MLSQIAAATGMADQDIAEGEHLTRSAISALPAHQGEPMDLRKSLYFKVHFPLSMTGDLMAGACRQTTRSTFGDTFRHSKQVLVPEGTSC